MTQLPPWPHTANGQTAHITGFDTEYFPIFSALFETIDRLMEEESNSYAYIRTFDDDPRVPLNHPHFYEVIGPDLAQAISYLSQRLHSYTQSNDPFSMDIDHHAKTAITRAGGSYGQLHDSNYHVCGTYIRTPGGHLITCPEP